MSTTLIEQLKAEHRVMVTMLHQMLATADPETGKVPHGQLVFTLNVVREALIAHFAKQHELLYPVLRSTAASDRAIAKLLRSFDQARVSGPLSCFEQPDAAAQSNPVFPSDPRAFCKALEDRFLAEQTVLYPAFEQVTARRAAPTVQLPVVKPRRKLRERPVAHWLLASGGVTLFIVWRLVV
ncbi:MAG: hemerythrin domain-containing protein [Kofleriaceae bacterium]